MTPYKTQTTLVLISSAYCFYDLYICVFKIKYTLKQGSDFIFHHVIGITGALFSLTLGRWNVGLGSAALVSETSNFAMNMRWFMLKHGMSEHWLYLPMNITFALSFFLSRIVFIAMIFTRNV